MPIKTAKDKNNSYKWKFFRAGKVDQVLLESAEDLWHLGELDQKLWMALSMPCTGLGIPEKTLRLLDSDGDGHIRPPEILQAVAWVCECLKDPSVIFQAGDSLEISNIRVPEMRKSSIFLLKALGIKKPTSISYSDSKKRSDAFAELPFNGDGILELASIMDGDLRHQAQTILFFLDDEGQAIDRLQLEDFLKRGAAFFSWYEDLQTACPELSFSNFSEKLAALRAFLAVKDKIDDFFLRQRFSRFDMRSQDVLKRDSEELKAIAGDIIGDNREFLASFPLADISYEKGLPLWQGVNPLWADRLKTFAQLILEKLWPQFGKPLEYLYGSEGFLNEEDWIKTSMLLAPIMEIYGQGPEPPLADAQKEDVRRAIDAVPALLELVAKDEEHSEERRLVDSVEKLLRYRRDLGSVLRNFVNFYDFYHHKTAAFQAGKLYIDGRVCTLCIELASREAPSPLVALSGAYLLYCNITRSGQEQKQILAMVSSGSDENLLVGRNGVFYDRLGQDWNASVQRIISAPISVRQAFWQPYKKLYRMIEEQIIKRAQNSEKDVVSKLAQPEALGQNAATMGSSQASPRSPKKMDLGAIALIGTAVGGISALVSAFFQSLFGLGLWLPLGIVALLLLISGPSMLLASMKLRKRNLGPILDANGWAINTMARINIPFGNSLTHIASPPPGNRILRQDPFKKKTFLPKLVFIGLAILLIAISLALLPKTALLAGLQKFFIDSFTFLKTRFTRP